MKINSFVIAFVIFFILTFQLAAQETLLWKRQNKQKTSLKFATKIKGQQELYTLKTGQFLNTLESIKESENKALDFPLANGEFVTFLVKNTSVLHPDLAKKYPEISSYTGVAKNDNNTRIYVSKTIFGIHAMIVSADKGNTFIEPAIGNKNLYSIFKKEDAISQLPFSCLAENLENHVKSVSTKALNANDLKLRTYRLAIATTEEYSNFQVDEAGLGTGANRNDSINAVMSAIVVTMTRVNAVFGNDLAIKMQLVPNNDKIIFLETDPGDDPYTDDNSSKMLTQNQTTLDNIIGFSNYDIGHVFSTGGGGLAYLASVCTNSKAKGVTGSSNPIGEPFYIDYVAHEMGHQFGANHTFNGTAGSCGGGNRNDPTAVEPGSGSTIMGYAGLCANHNVQNLSDSYFHKVSIEEIMNNVTNGAAQCATISNFANNLHVPVVNAGADFTIPKSTPFALTGQGSDADGNVLTYCWEQIDNEVVGISIPPSPTQTQGAVFRSFPPNTSPIRHFPKLATQIYGSSNENWEVLPNISRDLNFSLTVRDNVPGEGQTVSDEVKITVNEAAGPFVVTSQNNTNINWEIGSTETISWDVAGTDANGINVDNVNILLSKDGGFTFDTVLAANTPNDGSQEITVPNTPTYEARIMVAAANNIFYNINKEPFTIGDFITTCNTFAATDIPKAIPDNDTNGVVSSIQINDSFTLSEVEVTLDINHTWLWDLQVFLKSPAGTEILIYDRSCGGTSVQRQNIDAVFDDDAPDLTCNNSIPAINGIVKPAELLNSFKNEDAAGIWQLKAVDNSEQDTGILNSWALKICETNQTVSTSEFKLANFAIYPNPAKDAVNISFRPDTADPVSIIIYDLSGRSVKQAVFNQISPIFNKQIKLRELTSGVYIVQVKNGKATVNRKLIKF